MMLAEPIGFRFFGEPSSRDAVRRGLARLPDDVRDFAAERCVFLTVGSEAHAYFRPTEILDGRDWIVLVNSTLSDRSVENCVAHEVAHIWLGHEWQPPSDSRTDETETEVRQVLRSWGFRGFGT